MSQACDKCGTTDFAVQGRAFALSFACPQGRLVICSACAGRVPVDGISVLCCSLFRLTGLRNVAIPPRGARMIKVLYEDNHCLVVNKPAGLLTQGDVTGAPSVLDHARAYLKDRYAKP